MKNLILVDNGNHDKVANLVLRGDCDAKAVHDFLLENFSASFNAALATQYIKDFQEDFFTGWTPSNEVEDHFQQIRVKFQYLLSGDEMNAVTNAIAYAFKEIIRGEQLSLATVIHQNDGYTILEWSYDTTKTRSDDPDFQRFFELAEQYMVAGSPIRKTNHAGENTKGTRKVEGIGHVADKVEIYVK